MAATNYTPIQLYRTTTLAAAPVSGNLTSGELAINVNDADMALYAKNNTGNVKRLMNNPAGLKYPTADGTANQVITTDGSGVLTLVTPQVTSATLSASTGSTLIGTTNGGTGAVTRTVASKLNDAVSVKDFGAVGDNSTDDTVAIQSAINAVSSGAVLYFPQGIYRISATLNITNGIRLQGANRFYSIIRWSEPTLEAINIVTDSPVEIEHLGFQCTVAASAGYAVSLVGVTQNAYSKIDKCFFNNCFWAIYTGSAAIWTISNSIISAYQASGVVVQNTYIVDSGDSTIFNNVFSNSSAGAVAINHMSSGGLRVLCNKINSGAYGYRMLLATGANTSDTLINGNSIENCSVAAISFTTTDATSSYSNVEITGNQIAITPIPIRFGTTYTSMQFNGITITGNSLATSASGTVGITLNNVSNLNVSGNTCIGNGTIAAGISTGLYTSGNIGINTFNSAFTSKVVNASSAVFVSDTGAQSGTSAATCSLTYGSLYSATVAVTFPIAFGAANVPRVTVDSRGISGGVSAWPTTVTATGFSYTVLSVTNGGTGTVTWVARGVL
jgi:hypothetical protein